MHVVSCGTREGQTPTIIDDAEALHKDKGTSTVTFSIKLIMLRLGDMISLTKIMRGKGTFRKHSIHGRQQPVQHKNKEIYTTLK